MPAELQSNKTSHWFYHVLGPLFLILATPPTVFIFWYTNVYLDGSFTRFTQLIYSEGIIGTFAQIWLPYFWGSSAAWSIIGIFAAFQLLLMRILPGKLVEGPVTPAGNTPIYKANGVAAFFVTMAAFYLSTSIFDWFPATIIYDHFGSILGALNIFSLLFCLFLMVKGIFFPSSADNGRSGNFLFDFYWGTELYPRILGWDVKMFTNCRFAMMSWPLIIWSFAAKQQQFYGSVSDSMLVAVALQWIYVAKFFIWEVGYLRSLDIMHDRAGYYICWGVLVWLPGIYTSSTLYLVGHPNQLGWPLAAAIFLTGAISIAINYLADRQRQRVRATSGNCKVWGRPPVLTQASYITEKGERKQNVLLASGWWGLSRHFHYLPEILAALCWTLPALFDNYLPYFYVFPYLVLLLTLRAYRDDERCARKYGTDWNLYCEKVPYKIIPYIV